MEEHNIIGECDKPVLMRYLLLHHKLVNDADRKFSASLRNNSIYNSLQLLKGWDRSTLRRSTISGASRPRDSVDSNVQLRRVDSAKIDQNNSDNQKTPKKDSIDDGSVKLNIFPSNDSIKAFEDPIMKRIPKGADATVVFCGTLNFVKKPTLIITRLLQSVQIPLVTEVPVPVTFVVVLIGASDYEGDDFDYHEVGRCISTLMSNPSFNCCARSATDRRQLLAAINDFLSISVLLPPGKWDHEELLPFDDIKTKMARMMRKKLTGREPGVKTCTKKMSMTPSVDAHSKLGEEQKPEQDEDYVRDPLKRTGRAFGGLVDDIRHRYPFYKSDFIDGFNGQCFAATIFMYFAALSSAVTFGGLMSDKTDNYIGISESLISSSITGVFFALFSGQPMMVIGTTGPLLLFDESLYMMCVSSGIDYLTFRLYVGFWSMLLSLVVAYFEGSVLVKVFTRFTVEIFFTITSFIFIWESIAKMINIFRQHPLLGTYCDEDTTNVTATNVTWTNSSLHSTNFNIPYPQPNTALFSAALTLGTFIVAYYLKALKGSKFFGRNSRRMLGDFGVPLSIVVMVMFKLLVSETYVDTLNVPEGLNPSDSTKRGWFVPPFGVNGDQLEPSIFFGALIPAFMVYIINYMETHIAELLVDTPDRKLIKGSGFHFDIVIICFLNVLCAIIGSPFVCVATIRSVAHATALTVMSRTHAPGEKPYIVRVIEQRLSGIIVSILLGVSILISPLLKSVPQSVLFGVFLSMGIASLNGIQLFERIVLFFKPTKHHPPVIYVKRVPTLKMHIYTLLQVGCLILLWVVKSSKASLAFPFVLALMIPFRYILSYFFTHGELLALDGKQSEIDADAKEGEKMK